jgi:hypothetical protein
MLLVPVPFEPPDLALDVPGPRVGHRTFLDNQRHCLVGRMALGNEDGRGHGHAAMPACLAVDKHTLSALDDWQGCLYASVQGA